MLTDDRYFEIGDLVTDLSSTMEPVGLWSIIDYERRPEKVDRVKILLVEKYRDSPFKVGFSIWVPVDLVEESDKMYQKRLLEKIHGKPLWQIDQELEYYNAV